MEAAPHPSGAQWTISYGDQEAVVVEIGGGLRTYRAGGVDLVDGFEPDEMPVGGAGQVLAPWPNRIRDGQYTFGGELHQLPLTEPDRHNAIHGLVRWQAWRLVESDKSALTCECQMPAQPGYPWPLLLRSTWSLGDAGLRAEHWVTNRAGRPAPFGFSVHPYLKVVRATVDEVALRVPARTRVLTDSRLLPVGAAKIEGTEYDFTSPRRIGEMVLDTAFGGVLPDPDGGSTVTLRAPDGTGVGMWADDAFGWWQVFTGETLPELRRRRSIAVEPMTCPPDAFRSGRDVLVLEPGQTWHGSWRIHPLSPASR